MTMAGDGDSTLRGFKPSLPNRAKPEQKKAAAAAWERELADIKADHAEQRARVIASRNRDQQKAA